LRYFEKCQFLGQKWPFDPVSRTTRIFKKNRASSLLFIYDPETSCKKSGKTNERILRKTCYERTDGRTNGRTNERSWIYRTPSAKPGVQKFIFKYIVHEKIYCRTYRQQTKNITFLKYITFKKTLFAKLQINKTITAWKSKQTKWYIQCIKN